MLVGDHEHIAFRCWLAPRGLWQSVVGNGDRAESELRVNHERVYRVMKQAAMLLPMAALSRAVFVPLCLFVPVEPRNPTIAPDPASARRYSRESVVAVAFP